MERAEGLQDGGLKLREGTEVGDRLGRRLPGSSFLAFPPPPPCPSTPSEFSSISWISGGMDPGISIFSVITRSAPEEWRQRQHQTDSKSSTSEVSLIICSWHHSRDTSSCFKVLTIECVCICTLYADAPEVCNFHQYFWEHTGFIRPPPPHIHLHQQADMEKKLH